LQAAITRSNRIAGACPMLDEAADLKRTMRVLRLADRARAEVVKSEIPIRVRDAAVFLGVSPQTVYLWVERRQIPHFRVMGRNIRFLKSELEPFRAQFKQEVENWQDR